MAAKRTELEFVNFVSPLTWPHRSAYAGVHFVARDSQTRLFLGEEAGLRVVLIENPTWQFPARVPLTNVASFALAETER